MGANKKEKPTEKTGFSDFELEAMRERLREHKTEALGDKADGESQVMARIAEMPEPDRSLAQRMHSLIMEVVPTLVPRLWYGMPAYAKDGKVLCFFQSGIKYKTRYCTLGFSDAARLDSGNFWPSAYAIMALTSETEVAIRSLLKKAAS